MKTDKPERKLSSKNTLHNIKSGADKPTLGVDVDYYQSIIDDPDVSESRKRELIEIVGAIIMNFIDIGFGVHPIQLARLEKHQQQKHSEKENLLERSDV